MEKNGVTIHKIRRKVFLWAEYLAACPFQMAHLPESSLVNTKKIIGMKAGIQFSYKCMLTIYTNILWFIAMLKVV